MTLHPLRVLRVARALWWRDRAILFPFAGLFLFVPQWAILLLVPAVPTLAEDASSEAAAAAWTQAFSAWITGNGLGYILAGLATQFGTLAVVALYVGPGAGQAGHALMRAAAVFGRFLLAALMVWAPLVAAATLFVAAGGPGLALAIAPVLYLLALALLMLVAPAVTAGPGGAAQAVARAWRLARGHRGALAALSAALTVVGPVGAAVPLALARSLSVGGLGNPLVLALLDAGAALALAGGTLALALAGVVAYRALSR